MPIKIELEYGLYPEILQEIKDALASFDEIERIVLFGSRARGDFTPRSDIDIAIDGKNLSYSTFLGAGAALDDLPIIFKIDLVAYPFVENEVLKAKIDADGKILWLRLIERVRTKGPARRAGS